MIKLQVRFAPLLLLALVGGCLAGSASERGDSLLANEAPAQVTKSLTGDFFIDPLTELGWSTRVSVLLTYSEAHSYCGSLGTGWRLPTVGELKTTLTGDGNARTMKPEWKQGLGEDGVLFSGEEIPVIDDDKQPLVMSIANGHSFNGHGYQGYVRCVHGPITRQRKPFPVPPAKQLGQPWWAKRDGCPVGSVARGTPGLVVSCKNSDGKIHGRRTSWAQDRRTETNYRQGELHGKSTKWRADGTKAARLSYRHGQRHGRSTYWYQSGKKSSESDFSNGLLNGVQQHWDKHGGLQLRTRYRNARIIEQQHYDTGKARNGLVEQKHANGVLSYSGAFDKGRAMGKHIGYHDNGKARFERNYDTKGIPDGPSVDWHPNGQPQQSSTFQSGTLQGERVLFDTAGKPVERLRYDQGVLLKE